jgi:hypothetical protein
VPPSPDSPSAGWLADYGAASPFEAIRDTPGLRRLLVTARAWGVRPSELLAWPDDERELALALTDYEADCCPGCGTPMSVTTAPEAEERFVPGDAIRCHRCTAVSQAAAIHQTEYHPAAVMFTVRERVTGDTGAGEHGHTTQDDRPAEAGGTVQGG